MEKWLQSLKIIVESRCHRKMDRHLVSIPLSHLRSYSEINNIIVRLSSGTLQVFSLGIIWRDSLHEFQSEWIPLHFNYHILTGALWRGAGTKRVGRWQHATYRCICRYSHLQNKPFLINDGSAGLEFFLWSPEAIVAQNQKRKTKCKTTLADLWQETCLPLCECSYLSQTSNCSFCKEYLLKFHKVNFKLNNFSY